MSALKPVTIRVARPGDVPGIQDLIALSARALSRGFYTTAQTEAAIAHVFGVDTTLIADRTCFVAEAQGDMLACGGWSRRRALFGGDQYAKRDTALADPATDAAKIRAFFVHPHSARRGVARALLQRCEREAFDADYKSVELMSTLPGFLSISPVITWPGIRLHTFTGIRLRSSLCR